MKSLHTILLLYLTNKWHTFLQKYIKKNDLFRYLIDLKKELFSYYDPNLTYFCLVLNVNNILRFYLPGLFDNIAVPVLPKYIIYFDRYINILFWLKTIYYFVIYIDRKVRRNNKRIHIFWEHTKNTYWLNKRNTITV